MCLILVSAPPEPASITAAPSVALLDTESKYSSPRPPTTRADIASPSYFETAIMSGEELARLARQAFFRFGSDEQAEDKCMCFTL
jgi:hypothetical protein